MKHLFPGAVVGLLFSWLALPAVACSMEACVDKGMEMRPDFVITVKHDDRPLAGVSVEVTANTPRGETQRFVGTTARNGTVRVASLPPGEYWLHVQLLGIYAEYSYLCFHVPIAPSGKARRRLNFDWGDLAPTTSRVAGTLIDCQPRKDQTPFLNLVNCVRMPVAGARFKLQNAITGATYTTASRDDGSFTFGEVSKGTYVLHVEGGRTPTRDYDSADLLFKVSATARPNRLVLTRKDPGGGGCGGTSLDLETGDK